MTRAVAKLKFVDLLAEGVKAKSLLRAAGVDVLPSVWEITELWALRRQKVTPAKLARRYLLDLADEILDPTEAGIAPALRKERTP